MANIGELNIDEFLGGELNPDEIRALLSEGQSAYNSVKNLATKNGQLIGEIRTARGRYTDVETKLAAKGLSIEQLETLDLNPTNDAQIAQFKQQLENERLIAQKQVSDTKAIAAQFESERDAYRINIEQNKIKTEIRNAAAAVGISTKYIEDLPAILKGRDISIQVDDSGAVKMRRSQDVVDYDPKSFLTNLKSDPTFQPYCDGVFAGGSGTVPGQGKTGGKNPWAAESFNMTEQTRMYNENPALASQMKELAGG